MENKDSWNRKEVRGLLIKLYNEFPEKWELEEWMKQNLKNGNKTH